LVRKAVPLPEKGEGRGGGEGRKGPSATITKNFGRGTKKEEKRRKRRKRPHGL